MTKRFFGTDGVRGRANTPPLTPGSLVSLAQASGLEFQQGDHRHTVVIGKDTRLSGYMVESSLAAGFLSVGMDVIYLGPIPTPAVSILTRSLRADLGVVISASHNPAGDNGIKFFGPNGLKLTDASEKAIEQRMDNLNLDMLAPAPLIGHARRLEDAPGRYIEYVKGTFPKGMRLDGLKIVIDCAHGAAYKIAPTVLWELGADIIPIGVTPNGKNINDNCGATCLDAMRTAVITHKADLGIALDGDADRVILADETGHVIDGDALIGLIATQWKRQGILQGSHVVGTVMSNLGLERFLQHNGLELIRTHVGDRYVVDAMHAHDANVGGEQSGHVILKDYVSTGDGLITALQFLALLIEQGGPASRLGSPFTPVPQILKNIQIQNPQKVLQDTSVQEAISDAEEKLGSRGRILVRKSGTEPVIRIMAEGDTLDELHTHADAIAHACTKVGG